jgi:hypothetical protein
MQNKILVVIDVLIPLTLFSDLNKHPLIAPTSVKNKIKIRKRLVGKSGLDNIEILRNQINTLSHKEIKSFHNFKFRKFRRSIMLGNYKSLWKAVKLSKDRNTVNLSNVMCENKFEIIPAELP